MRPKKVVYLVDADEAALSLRRFLLETHRYRVVTATSAVECLNVMEEVLAPLPPSPWPDVLAVSLEIVGVEHVVQRVKHRRSEVPILLFSSAVSVVESLTMADSFLGKGFKPRDFLERLRVLTRSKRGPKTSAVIRGPQYLTGEGAKD